jgi:cystathionine gamma-synthase
MSAPRHHIETRLAGAGCTPDPRTGDLTPPLHLATTFERDPDGGYSRGFVYGRTDNPTRQLFETTLADLEGGAEAAAFASGMAAINAVLQTLAPGEHVIMPSDAYHGVRTLLHQVFGRWGLEWTEVDQTDLDAVAAAIRPTTTLIWCESPSNPQLRVVDIRGLAAQARDAGAALVLDGTWTPTLQRGIELGADLVIHSLTKYLSGHSDALGGAVVAADAAGRFADVRRIQTEAGAVLDPFSCWLVLRGMRSLGARMRVHCANARVVAGFLERHPAVERVNYPGLPSHPGHRLAMGQMREPGGMLSFLIVGGEPEAMGVVAGTQVFRRATSLGGTESLIEHRASIEGPLSTTPPNLIRLSVGLEHEDDLLEDLAEALGAVSESVV